MTYVLEPRITCDGCDDEISVIEESYRIVLTIYRELSDEHEDTRFDFCLNCRGYIDSPLLVEVIDEFRETGGFKHER